MTRVDAIRLPKRRRRMSRWTLRRLLAALVVAVAVVLLAFRVQHAFRGFLSATDAAVGRNGLGGALAGADSLDIDNGFVVAAVQMVPTGARYAVLLPPSVQIAQTNYGIDPITIQALPAFMREVLLPRLPTAEPVRGDYVLCYDCDTSPWDHRTRWLWTDAKGRAVGRVYR